MKKIFILLMFTMAMLSCSGGKYLVSSDSYMYDIVIVTKTTSTGSTYRVPVRVYNPYRACYYCGFYPRRFYVR